MEFDGRALRALRRERRISREKLARLADTSTSTIFKLEAGDTSDPGAGTVAKIARALGVPLDALFTRENGTAA